jgi:hypothetical protein
VSEVQSHQQTIHDLSLNFSQQLQQQQQQIDQLGQQITTMVPVPTPAPTPAPTITTTRPNSSIVINNSALVLSNIGKINFKDLLPKSPFS